MAWISERISEATATVTCPGCGRRVVPAVRRAHVTPLQAGSSESGKRWSFIWRPPSESAWSECLSPLERLARRMKWVHTASFGSVPLVLGALVVVVRLMGREGAVALVVGLAGIVLGGRHAGPSAAA